MCTAAEPYAWGGSGNITCPENAVRIGSAEACHRAADVMGMDWKGSENKTDLPSGCFRNEIGTNSVTNVYFNTHPVGSGNPHARQLCAAFGTAPRTFARDVPYPPFLRTHAQRVHRAHATAPTELLNVRSYRALRLGPLGQQHVPGESRADRQPGGVSSRGPRDGEGLGWI